MTMTFFRRNQEIAALQVEGKLIAQTQQLEAMQRPQQSNIFHVLHANFSFISNYRLCRRRPAGNPSVMSRLTISFQLV